MRRNNMLKNMIVIAVHTGIFSIPIQGWAQEVSEKNVLILEEITVTATKRSASLQDVPISVSAITGRRIQAMGIQRAEELSALIPNFSIQQDPIGDKINIRGIQSGNNAGLEQSIATFVDGVYRGRGAQTRFAFLDIERVEVLRGPQGTLFGKNTNGGAIRIISAGPEDEFGAALSGGYTFDNMEEYEFIGHASGPISDTLRARVAGQYRDLNKGYIDNIFYNQSTPTLKEFAIRGTLEWDVSEDTLVVTRFEYGDYNLDGQNFGNIVAGPLALFVDTQEGSFTSSNIGSINPVLDIGSSGTSVGKNLESSLTITHDLASGIFTAIGAFSAYDYDRECDCDFSAVDVLRFDDREDFEQFSLEARYVSDTGNTVDYIFGAYFQQNELKEEADTFFNVRGSGNEIAIDTVLGAACDFFGNDPAVRECILNGLVTAFDGSLLEYTDFTRRHFLNQDDKLLAGFVQATWNISDRFSVTGGIRYTYERKTATQGAFAINFGSEDNPVINQIVGNSEAYAAAGAPGFEPFSTLAEAQVHENDLGRTENALTWSVNLKWNATDDIMIYGSASTGFKAGGFNSFALSADPTEAEFEEEDVLGFELGSKVSLLNGAAELNFAFFYTEFTDIQTALFTGSTSFIVQNASSATSKGIEIDGRWALTSNLLITGGIAYVKFKFDEYPNAGCFADQLLKFRDDSGNPLATTQDCSDQGINDLSGRTSENTPEFSGSLNLQHTAKIVGEFELNTYIDAMYQSEQFRQADLDPALLQGGFVKVNFTTSFGPVDGLWDISLLVKNLFNERTFSYGNDTPLFDGALQFIADRPRTVSVRVRTKF